MLFLRERFKNATKQAIEDKRLHRGLSDLLGYLFLWNESTVFHKDGALSAHFRYFPSDVETLTDAELDAVSDTWQRAIAFLGDGWLLETQVMSSPVNRMSLNEPFPDPVSECIENERQAMIASGRYYQSNYFLSLTWKPNVLTQSWLRRFIWGTQKSEHAIEEEVEIFQKKVGEFVGFLERTNPLQRLQGDELVGLLHRCLSGETTECLQPHIGAFLDTYIVTDDFIGGFQPKMGQKQIQCLAIDTLSSHSHPSLLDSLSHLPCEYRWSSRLVCMDPVTAKQYLKRYERSWSSKAIGLMGVIRESFQLPAKVDRDAQAMAEMIEQAQAQSSSGALGYGFYNSTLVLMHEDKEYLDTLSEHIIHHIQQMNFRVRRETVNATESFLGSLPCHGDYNLRKMMVDTRFVSHALPMSGIYQGESQCPCPYYPKPSRALMWTSTDGNRPFYLNHFVGDVGHTAILGPTGSGKSTLVAAMMASHRQYSGSRVIVLDKDASHRTTIKALNGSYFSLSMLDGELAPMASLNAEDPLSVDRAVNWLSDICELQHVVMTPERQRLLREGVERLANEPSEYKSLNYFNVQEPELRAAIQAFNQGARQALLNGTQSSLNRLDVMGIDLTELLQQAEHQVLVLPVIQAILSQLESCFADKRPTLLILEEAWSYLAHPIFRQKLTDWFKTLRKANVSVIFISQDLSDIVDSGSASVIQNSCLTRVYLANPQAKEPAVRRYYEAFGLNDREVEVLSQMIPKRDYYYTSCLGRRRFQLDLGERAKALLCISEPHDLAVFEKVHQSKNHAWIQDWLEYKKCGRE